MICDVCGKKTTFLESFMVDESGVKYACAACIGRRKTEKQNENN